MPLKCTKCGVTRVALGMGHNQSLRSMLDGELPTLSFDNCCPDCGSKMEIDLQLGKF